MTILVDSSVWSLALRRRPADLNAREGAAVEALRTLMAEGRAALIGPIRQEVLSGMHEHATFARLRRILLHLPNIPIHDEDYDRAAECYNACRRAGLAATAIDMLLCAVARRAEVPLFSVDADFNRYRMAIGLTLFDIA